MLTCPLCKKSVPGLERECPACRADLSLLVDYVEGLRGGLERAESLVRAGELGEAVWAYLAVLEADPEQPEARRQVGQVAAAVRQFDRASPGRRWLRRLRRRERLRGWLGDGAGWGRLAAVAAVLAALALGFAAGRWTAPAPPTPPPEAGAAAE